MKEKTAIVPFDRAKLAQSLQQTQQAAAPSHSFLRFSKTGEWVVGVDADEVPESVQFIVNPQGFQHGYICWGEGVRLGEVIKPVTEPLPEPGAVPNGGRGWEFQLGAHLKALNGDIKGSEYLYRASSVGGKKAIAALAGLVAAQVNSGRDEICPVVTLAADSYKHQQYGKIFTPVINIVKWVKMPADDGDAEVKAAPKKLAKPKKK